MPRTSFLPALATLACALTCSALAAETAETNATPLPWRLQTPVAIRLGDWLAEAPPIPGAYEPGLMWLSPREQPAQRALAQQVQAALQALQDAGRLPLPAARDLAAFLAALPVTGRLLLPSQDLRVMQARPTLDPLAAPGDELVRSPRPDTVTLLHDDGRRCELRFRPGAGVAHYVARCPTGPDDRPVTLDEAWLVQPDGGITRIGVAPWNAVPHDPPAPGAWLWLPSRAAGWPERSSRLVAEQLATQGPSGVEGAAGVRPARLPDRPGGEGALSDPPPPRDLPLTAGDWGITGLLQTPTARTRPAGHVGFTVSRTVPYTHFSAVLSPFDGLEIGVRYTDLSNQLYGPEIAGDRSYKDKSSDLKLRLVREDAVWPEVAVGLRDPGGTGLFAGEYLVGSKRWGDVDLSLGLGWGYLGGRGSLPNPLSVFGRRFDTRTSTDIGAGGTAHLGTLFSGRTALFGGLQWHTPWAPLLVKLEVDGNGYQHEPFGSTLDARWPVNLGVVWRTGPFSLNAGLARGRTASIGFSVQTALDQVGMPKAAAPRRLPVDDTFLRAPTLDTPAAEVPVGDEAGHLLAELGEQLGWAAVALQRDGVDWVVTLDNAHGYYAQERFDRGVAVLHRAAPASVRGFRWVLASREVPVQQYRIDRTAWVESQTRWIPPRHRVDPITAVPLGMLEPVVAPVTPALPRSVNLGWQQNIGGPDGYLYALSLRAGGQWRLGEGRWVQGSADLRLLDNYDRFHYTAPSGLPRVRTYLREYLTTTRFTVPNLQLNQFGALGALGGDVFGLAYAGLLETMFAGVGGEVLWRPAGGAWGVGLDVNRVRQRGFEQPLALREYGVTTGHLTVHWDTGWAGVRAEVAVGQYLAGDRGATIDLSRGFDNGARIGAWVTKTNVSSARFGEGSFDKGLYLTVPFEALVSAWSGQSVGVAWQPLIRDGGARLQRAQTLWGLTQARDPQARRYRSAPGDMGE